MSKLQRESPSISLVSNLKCREKLQFLLQFGGNIHKSDEKYDCPRVFKINFGKFGPQLNMSDWEFSVMNILESIIPTCKLIELYICPTQHGLTLNKIESLSKIYNFIGQCPSLKKVLMPYTNDSGLLETLLSLVKEKGRNWNCLQLMFAKNVGNDDQLQTHPALFDIFGYICKNMINLRVLKIDLPNEGLQDYKRGYYEHLRARTMPLLVKYGIII
ncbi:hypothetical protein FGO68_gene12957 [Halteria grandinella]|uniref:Uncharacterized protein n=1 Tax=Halteria grandinella TaxID=5974 RepID=A0A8J8P5A6_HALGN|nr:hypothetical protein FGO68_gene12957 [Halteria grandinella]